MLSINILKSFTVIIFMLIITNYYNMKRLSITKITSFCKSRSPHEICILKNKTNQLILQCQSVKLKKMKVVKKTEISYNIIQFGLKMCKLALAKNK